MRWVRRRPRQRTPAEAPNPSATWRLTPPAAEVLADRVLDEVRRPVGGHRAMLEELAALSATEWLHLDVCLRDAWWEHFQGRWAGSQPEFRTALDVIAGMGHPEGRHRERAVDVAQLDDGHLVPMLLIRCVDWAEPVQRQALHRVEAWIKQAGIAEIAEPAPLIVALGRRDRGAELSRILAERAGASSGGELCRALMEHPDYPVRRTGLGYAIEGGALGLDELIAVARDDTDISVRRAAVAALPTGDECDRFFTPLLRSRFGAVRAEALWRVSRHDPAFSVPGWLDDPSASVRSVAQHLARTRDVDAACHYRKRLGSANAPTAALIGLGETGVAADAAAIQPFLTDPSPRRRAEAVRALRRVDGLDVQQALALVRDQAPRVVRQAARHLQHHAGQVSADQVEDLLDGRNDAHVRRAGWSVLRSRRGVPTILRVLQLLADDDPLLAATAHNEMRSWLARDSAGSYLQASAAEAQELRNLLTRLSDVLDERERRQIRFALGAP